MNTAKKAQAVPPFKTRNCLMVLPAETFGVIKQIKSIVMNKFISFQQDDRFKLFSICLMHSYV